ncbi:MAG: FliM/FliN family flagellar motor switch protein [Pikeienuella sp.]
MALTHWKDLAGIFLRDAICCEQVTFGMTNSVLRKKLDGSRIARPPVADIAQMAELFARLLEDRLRTVLHVRPHIRVETSSPQRRAAAFEKMAPGSLFALSMITGAFSGAAVFAPELAFRLIEMMTGVVSPPPQSDDMPEGEPLRALTSIDKALLHGPAAAVFEAFIDTMPAEPPKAIRRAFTHPRLSTTASVASDDDDVEGLSVMLSVVLTDETDSFVLPVFIPLSTLDQLMGEAAKATAKPASAPSVWSRAMIAAAKSAPFRMVGVLHEKAMSVGDIKDMKVGGIIPLPADHNMQIDLRIDTPQGISREPTVGGGVLGVVDGQRAVRLTAAPDATFLSHLDILRS